MKATRSGVLTTVLVVAALWLGSLISSALPAASDVFSRPYVHAARIGEPVTLRTATVTVTGVRTAKEVSSYGAIAGTTGVWLVADLEVEARHEPGLLAPAAFRLRAADGRLFGELSAVTVSCGPLQPGITVRCSVPFEITPDAVPGACLLVPAGTDAEASDDLADVDLGIDEARAAALASPETRIVLAEPTIVER